MTYPWSPGDILTASDLNSEFGSKVDYAMAANAQSGTGASAYTFVLADATRLTTATGTTAKTFTIPPQASVAWANNSIIRVANYGAGDLTIAGGSGVTVTNATKTLAQFESAALIRTASNAWTLVPFSGGVGNADFSDAATGTYTDSGISYKYIVYNSSGTLTVTKAGFADVLVVGGGAGCRPGSTGVGGGGAGGYLDVTQAYLPAGSLTVTVGAGGTGSGNGSRIGSYYALGGGEGSFGNGDAGGSGGGGGDQGATAGGAGMSGQGNSGGGYVSGTPTAGGGGGGAGAAGATIPPGGNGGNGGNGLASSITGSSVTRAGGGGGHSNAGTAGTGGTGGGGAGATGAGSATNGTANTGGGGGGSRTSASTGGSGVVIIRVRT